MKRDEIAHALRELLERQEELDVDFDAITEDTRIDAIGFNSLSILDFMYEVENRFGVPMEVADLVEMEVVRDLIDHLEAKLAR
jgi:acyl carrier protein